jgi:hypothetical protein
MDCSEFRDKHALLIDLRCSALEESEMRQHMTECRHCAHHDMIVRRSLMLVRSLPTIEPSPDFQARLAARLRSASLTPAVATPRPLRASFGAFVALAAGIGFVAYLAADALRQAPPVEIRMPPVVASLPELDASAVATPALVATVPTGMSVWPAIMVASQAPVHFVAAEMTTER